MSIQKVIRAIKKHKRFLISAHLDLEGDAIGSELALAELLRQLGKTVFVVNHDCIPETYRFIPGTERVLAPSQKIPLVDVAIVVDCSDLSRVGAVAHKIKEAKIVINIDHHMTSEQFGDINWINEKASSASEMIYTLFKAMKQKVNRKAAVALYAGIVTDTGSFKYSNTSAYTHAVTADLLRHPVDVYGVYHRIYQDIPFKDMRFVSRLLNAFKADATRRIVWIELTTKDNYSNLQGELSDIIFNFLRSIRGVEIAFILREKGNATTKVNLRSQGKADVGTLAARLGGGGHARASGFTYPAPLAVTRKFILPQLKKLIRS